MTNYKYFYKCIDCGKEYVPDQIRYLCPDCEAKNTPELPPKGVLKVIYDFSGIKQRTDFKKQLYTENYFSLLPLKTSESLPALRVGKTPVYNLSKASFAKGFNLFAKDDSQNPTYSFKDRASAIVSAFAKEQGIETIAAASTGNAGSSIAGICASQNQKAIVFVPAKAPVAKLTQILMYGAQLVPVDGTYDNAFDLSIEASQEFGWFNRNTAYNPFTIEGKKTVSFEIFDQFDGKVPDFVFVPVGDGVIISGVYKGFEDLLNLGLIEKIPTLVAVQAEGSNNLIRTVNQDMFTYKPSATVADSISVDIPRNYYMAKQYINKYKGQVVEVSDNEIISASALLSKETGLFAEPAAASSVAGFLKLKDEQKINENSSCIVLLTGSGLKDLAAVSNEIVKSKPINCDLKAVKKVLNL